MKLLTAGLAVLLCSATAAATIPPGKSRGNIVYGMYSGLALLLDVSRPAEPNGMAVLLVPGSGFQAPTVWDAPQLKAPAARAGFERALLDAGFTVVTINHRAAPRFRYPAAVEDGQRAARFIRANAAEFGVRADRLAAVGASSGGNIVAMLATRGEGNDETGAAVPVRRPDCVVAAMAPSDLKPLGNDGDAVGYVVSYLGHPPPYDAPGGPESRSFDADYAEASPISHVSDATSPMLLLHGDKDTLVPIDQSIRFAAALDAAGAAAELVTMTGVGHFVPPAYMTRAASWLRQCMTKPR